MCEPIVHDYTKVIEFKAPIGNKRDIVFDYYMKMANVEWTPKEDFLLTHSPDVPREYKLELEHKAGKKYYGIPYGNTKANLDEFMQFVDNSEFSCDSYYYTDIVGNHCSSSMFFAYQQIIPVGYGTFRPTSQRKGIFSLAGDLKNPGEGVWHSSTVFELNGEEAVYEAFATLKKSDILFKCIPGSGHVRMVSKVETVRDINGKIDPESSYIYVVEHTNLWFTDEQVSSWYIDKKRKFSTIFKTGFMPVTLDTFHDNNPITDAYVFYNGKNTAKTVRKGINGKIKSNYPLNYLLLTIKNENNKIVKKVHVRNLGETFEIDLEKECAFLDLSDLPAGKYELKLRASISRGGYDFEKFTFII